MFLKFTFIFRNGSAIKLDMPQDDRGTQTQYPKEKWKTFVAIVFVLFGFLSTTVRYLVFFYL